MNIIIRKAKIEDAAEIANVHVNSWREAYKGLLEEDFLNARPLQFKNRNDLWKREIADNQIVYVAESDKYGVIGFAKAGAARDEDLKNHGEVFCIYLLNVAHKKGVGFKLLTSCFEDLVKAGFDKAYLWVLDNNPTIKFYERAQGKQLDREKIDQIGNTKVREICYEWSDLKSFLLS